MPTQQEYHITRMGMEVVHTKRFWAVMKKALFPGWKGLLAATFLLLFSMAAAFGTPLRTTPAVYPLYTLSAYGLTVIVIALVQAVRSVTAKMKTFPILGRYMVDNYYKVWLSLRVSFLINLAFAIVKMVYAVRFSSFWEGGMAGYYIMLCVVRFYLLRRVPKSPEEAMNEKTIWRQVQNVGCILFALDLVLTGIATQIVRDGQGYRYDGMLIYVMAFYTFYCLGTSIANVVRYRKFTSPLLSAAKTVNLTCALVSILSLETAMLTEFGTEEDMMFRTTMTACTGLVICLIILALAAATVHRAKKNLKRLEKEGSGDDPYFSGRR